MTKETRLQMEKAYELTKSKSSMASIMPKKVPDFLEDTFDNFKKMVINDYNKKLKR